MCLHIGTCFRLCTPGSVNMQDMCEIFVCEICISWEPPVVKIAPAAGKCTHTSCFSLLSVSQTNSGCCYLSSENKHWLADNSHGCNIFALMFVRDARDVCSEDSEAPSSVNLAATEQLWSISILRSTEWGWVFSGMLFSYHSDSQTRSRTSSGKISFLFTCKSHCCASSLSELTFPTATHTSLLSANRHHGLISQQPSAMHTQKSLLQTCFKLQKAALGI